MKIHAGTASPLTPLKRRLSRRREIGQAVAENWHSWEKIVRSKRISAAQDPDFKAHAYFIYIEERNSDE